MDILIALFRELGTFNRDVFSHIQSYLHHNYYFYHSTLEDCLINREPKFKRKVVYLLSFIILIIHTIYSGILVTFPHQNIQALLGDPMFVYITPYEIVNGFWLCISIYALIGKFTLFYCEMSKKTTKMLFDLYDGSGFYKLSQQNEQKLLLVANVYYWQLIVILHNIAVPLLSIIYFVLRIIAYLYSPYEFGIITLTWMTIQTTICLKLAFAWAFGAITTFYIPGNGNDQNFQRGVFSARGGYFGFSAQGGGYIPPSGKTGSFGF